METTPEKPHLSRHMPMTSHDEAAGETTSSTPRRLHFDVSPGRHACQNTHLSNQGVAIAIQTDSSCRCAEPDIDKVPGAEEFEPTDMFQPGDLVCVVREFLSYDNLRIWLKMDMKGQVIGIDSDGDIQVRFPTLADEVYDVTRWVHSSDFRNLHVKRRAQASSNTR